MRWCAHARPFRPWPALVVVVLALVAPAPAVAQAGCTGLALPVVGPFLRGFAPIGDYAGHWGIDIGAPIGTPVRSAGVGVVSFSGSVADRLSVTVDHGGALRTSYSYLEAVSVSAGEWVGTGTVVGASGVDTGLEAVHFSVRVDGVYVDPDPWLRCHPPGAALWLTVDGAAGSPPTPAVPARSLCCPGCDAASSGARSTLPTWRTWSPPRPPTASSASTSSPWFPPGRRGRRPTAR